MLITFSKFSEKQGEIMMNYNTSVQALYDEIINNWSVEARKENPAYFYNVDEVSQILCCSAD